MTPEDFKRQLGELRSIILDGIAYFEAWRGLMVKDDLSAQALNRYRALFLPARNALLWMALLQFAKVYDTDPRTPSLPSLVTKAKRDVGNLTPYATREDLETVDHQISDNAAVLDRLKRLRNKRIAHHDSAIPKSPSLLFGEATELVEHTKSIYNSLRRGHDRSYTAFDNLSRDVERHTSQVVQVMREEMARVARRNERLLKKYPIA